MNGQIEIGDRVIDGVTGISTVVVDTDEVDGETYYLLDDLPTSDDYPTAWRWDDEIVLTGKRTVH